MKRNWKSKPLMRRFLLLASLPGLLLACGRPGEQRHEEGHVPHREGHRESASGQELYGAVIPVLRPAVKSMDISFRLSGRVLYDKSRVQTLSSRFGGRVEKLYVHSNFQPVRKGQKLLEIYSPEMVRAQQEYLYVLSSDPGNETLVAASRKKLSLLGMTGGQIRELESRGEAFYSLAVYSPFGGYVFEEGSLAGEGSSAAPASQGSPASAMQGMSAASGSSAPASGGMASSGTLPAGASGQGLRIREGAYVSKGAALFNLVNIDRVWAEFDVDAGALPHIREGEQLLVYPQQGEEKHVEARVGLVQSFYREGTRFLKVRVYLDNGQRVFRPGQLLEARLQQQSGEKLWIPASAIRSLGTRQIVYLKKGASFVPREIVTGAQAGEWIELRSGLSGQDSLVRNAGYMLDPESFVEISEIEHEN